ncbi:MAG: sensor histidine kinase [Elainellaceae cyanobacterium]
MVARELGSPPEAIAKSVIMIVDDHPTNIKLLFNLLQEEGYRVLVAQGGKSALTKLQEITPDLILMDVMMPQINGFEVCQQIKTSPATQAIPIIFMTALSDEVDKVKGLSIGAVDYITKPFQYGDVLARVNLHLQLAHMRRTLEQRVADQTQALSQALDQLKLSQLQLIQSEKMSAIGQFVAGVAHEINNPLNFIQNNLPHVSAYAEALIQHTQLVHQQATQAEIEDHAAAIELDYLLEDLPNAIASLQRGAERIYAVSTSLRRFTRSDDEKRDGLDIHEGIDNTLVLLSHRLKANAYRPSIEVIKQYDSLPAIDCFPGQIDQVLMNILVNAVDALDEKSRSGDAGADASKPFQERGDRSGEAFPYQITICTSVSSSPDLGRAPWQLTPSHRSTKDLPQSIEVRIGDSGLGIPPDVQSKIFDYLFTTKPVGQGTGLGLAIVHQIITKNHCGTIEVASTPGHGTEFTIRLPVNLASVQR